MRFKEDSLISSRKANMRVEVHQTRGTLLVGRAGVKEHFIEIWIDFDRKKNIDWNRTPFVMFRIKGLDSNLPTLCYRTKS